eukprot:TRINITY_DN5048_c0_g2_i1.p1 TRINITY_DN5048_c0_g2~~TRINITY_DN5048_c0_g2_i1.p1  ORF type:complete len:456 (-),score=85.59 TRINITY_DN5048_c0_g2_i1:425-1693(-)
MTSMNVLPSRPARPPRPPRSSLSVLPSGPMLCSSAMMSSRPMLPTRAARPRGVTFPHSRAEQEKARFESIVDELVRTENDYVADLVVVLTSFIIPLRDKEIITPQESELLFGNWEMLIDSNKHLLASLQSESVRAPRERDFGSIFLLATDKTIHNSFSNLYSRYCANIALSDRCRKDLVSGRPAFAEFLKASMARVNVERQQLKSFLIKPLQRLCKYPLLLKELTKYYPYGETAAYSSLVEALERMDILVARVNDSMLEGENQVKVLEVQDMFTWQDQTIQLAMPFRRLVQDDMFMHAIPSGTKRSKKRKLIRSRFFLFNDILVVGKEKNKSHKAAAGSYLLSAIIPLACCSTSRMDDPTKIDEAVRGRAGEPVLWIGRTDSRLEWGLSQFLLVCSSAQEQDEWHQALSECIQECAATVQGS